MELTHRNGHSNGSVPYQNGNSVHSSNGTLANYRIEIRTTNITSINDNCIPRDIYFRIFSFLDLTSLCRCSGVCQSNVIENLSRRAGPFLKSLHLKGCKNIGDNAIRIFAKHCNQPEELNLRECRDITDGNGCSNLEDLDLSWNKHITQVGFAALTAGCPNILRLRCAGVEKFNDTCLTLIGQSLNRLLVINILKCSRVSDEGVTRVCEGCPQLETLCLSQIPAISDHFLLALGQNCLNIRNLELNSCAAITDAGFSHLTRSRYILEDSVIKSENTMEQN
ncbi:F-box and leucine-rich repeat protein 13-like isoform X2 [Convolutriloba macropyga]|uniref:F-box and leucine-rich repeat protein 13-like isoform X2 n=1 Tax=Convolutriloba macropyga TaxID=536237 RepID=UPI003F52074E